MVEGTGRAGQIGWYRETLNAPSSQWDGGVYCLAADIQVTGLDSAYYVGGQPMSHKAISTSSPAMAVMDSPPMSITAVKEPKVLGAGELVGAGVGCGWDWALRSKARPSAGAGCGSNRRMRRASDSMGDMLRVGKLCGDGGLAGGLADAEGGTGRSLGALYWGVSGREIGR